MRAVAVAAGLLTGIAALKPLNILMLGEQYAATMGVDLRRSRSVIFISTTLLAGTVTAFCGPIGFVGLAVPHVVRTMFGNADCRVVMPGLRCARSVHHACLRHTVESRRNPC